MRTCFAIISVIPLLVSAGCATSPRLEGTWRLIQKNDPDVIHPAFDDSAIIFHGDGTGFMLHTESGKRESFQYVATDHRLTFNPGDEWEVTFPYRISAGLLVLKEDLVFERRE
jgi:hypothetical protein